jgi:hypothetical protein
MKSSYTIAAIACVLVLSACGCGGGSASVSAPPVTLSAITSANASMAAENGYGAGRLLSIWSAAMPDFMTGVNIAPADAGLVSPVLDLIKDAYRQDGGNLLTGAIRSYPCSGGGTMSVDATVGNQSTPTNGDTWSFTANNCVINSNAQNGSLSVKVSGVSGDIFHSATGGITLDTLFNNFSLTRGSMITAASGDMKIGIVKTSSTNRTFVVSGASLVETLQQSGTTLVTRTLTSYSVTSSEQGELLTTSANFSLSGSSNRLGPFAYTVKNLQSFVGSANDMPTSGALIVNGAGSSVTMTATANGARVDYSDNANGTITNTSTRSWSDFLSDY